MKQTMAIYNVKKLTLIFLKYRREMWTANEAMKEQKLKPRLRADYRNERGGDKIKIQYLEREKDDD